MKQNKSNSQKKVIIIGAGPAGLTAAFEILKTTDMIPVIYEKENMLGGISKTINYKGNRIDIGGHRFFSKSSVIMDWWTNILPIQGKPSKDEIILKNQYNEPLPNSLHSPSGPDPEKTDKTMLIRNRLSRIRYLGKFFDYPIKLNLKTVKNLGIFKIIKSGLSYIKIRIFPIKKEVSLQDFITNRFGKELYQTFFKDYTEKVWGTQCDKIPADWGAQRIKGVSIKTAILDAIKSVFKNKTNSIKQQEIETSLIKNFMYPKLGPGQLWEEVAKLIINKGGEIHLLHTVKKINVHQNKIKSIIVENENKEKNITCEFLISSMPIKDLINGITTELPENVKTIGENLEYRDFMTVGLLVKKLRINNQTNQKTINNLIPDTWIYIQEPKVKLGRLQIFNNWSPYMVKDINTVWIGLEYFVNENDEYWNMKDSNFATFAINELESIGIINKENVLDQTVIRIKKAYPAYFGAYNKFDVVRNYLDSIENLFLVGRNGMHRYNNMDHSMLTAMEAVKNIKNGILTKDNIWDINADKIYHEKK